MGFVNRMEQWPGIGIRMKKLWWSSCVSMVDVVIQGVWVLYRINKDKGDESLALLASSASASAVMTQNQVQSEHMRIQGVFLCKQLTA